MAKVPSHGVSSWLLAGLLFCGGCKDKSTNNEPVAPPPTPAAATPQPVAHVASATPAPVFPKLTPEQAASTVRVRIAAGTIPPRNHVGALLHRDEVANIAGLQGNDRCVLALLSGWTAEQLHSPQCVIQVLRSQPGGEDTKPSNLRGGRLLQFDETSGLAAIWFAESFDSTVDVGYHIDRTQGSAGPTCAVRSTSTEDVNQAARTRPILRFESGVFSSNADKRGSVQFAAGNTDPVIDDAPALVSGKDKLAGFLAMSENATLATFVPLRDFKLEYKAPKMKVSGVGFGKSSGRNLPIVIKAAPEDPALAPRAVVLRQLESPDARGTDLTERPTYSPIETKLQMGLYAERTNEWKASLQAPQADGEEKVYLLQLGWTAFANLGTANIFGRPFVVTLRNQAGAITPSVTGVQDLNAVKEYPQGPVTPFALEAAIRDFHEIAGGREVLIQLEAAPYWKRFSFTSNQWLPLPPINLSDAYLAGNRSALFILDRGAAELRKYDLKSLQQTAAVKLPTDNKYVAVVAGCNSDRAPIHVIMEKSTMSLYAENLGQREYLPPARKSHSDEKFAAVNDLFHVTGDGLSFQPYTERSNTYRQRHYTDDALGAHPEYFDGGGSLGECGGGVSGAYIGNWNSGLFTRATRDGKGVSAALPRTPSPAPFWLIPNSPTYLRSLPPDPSAIPAAPARVECISYFDSTPFAVVEVPEWAANQRPPMVMNASRWMAFDPNSMRLGVISLDRKQWLVHQIVPIPSRTQPVLLNWPETALTRGEELHFKPLLLGTGSVSAEVLGTKSKNQPRIVDGEISVTYPADELASLSLLNLTVQGKDGQLSYAIPVHHFGPEPAIAAGAAVNAKGIDALGDSFKSIPEPKEPFMPLRTSIHVFKDPVRDVLGPLAGQLVLVTEAGRVDLLSVEERKITRSIPAPVGSLYFAGAGALFEYAPAAGTLTRISIPDGRRERSLNFPKNLRLHALGIGTDPDSPITLLVDQIQRQETERFGDLNLTLTLSNGATVILDNHTLQATGWAQPKRTRLGDGTNFQDEALIPQSSVLPASRDGRFVTLPALFLALGHSSSYAVQFPALLNRIYDNRGNPNGSISGTIVTNYSGWIYRGGIDQFENARHTPGVSTPCGRYRYISVSGERDDSNHLEVRTIENDRPLFQLARLSVNRRAFEAANETIQKRLIALGENGPLAVLAGGGQILQVIDCNVPKLAQMLAPESFHVTSQAPPAVASGAAFDYQIQVNNPEIVASYRLREPTAGTTISPQGLLHYVAPAVTSVTRAQISTEVVGKDGTSVAHDFPIFILP